MSQQCPISNDSRFKQNSNEIKSVAGSLELHEQTVLLYGNSIESRSTVPDSTETRSYLDSNSEDEICPEDSKEEMLFEYEEYENKSVKMEDENDTYSSSNVILDEYLSLDDANESTGSDVVDMEESELSDESVESVITEEVDFDATLWPNDENNFIAELLVFDVLHNQFEEVEDDDDVNDDTVILNGNLLMIHRLKRRGNIKSLVVQQAFEQLPRSLFVSPGTMHPFELAPTRTHLDFNISSPSLQAIVLEHMELETAKTLLDIGSGSGFFTLCASYIMGQDSFVQGIDIKEEIVNFSVENFEKAIAYKQKYETNEDAKFGFVEFFKFNVLLEQKHPFLLPRYDRIHSGLCCNDEQIAYLLDKLNDNGILVSPRNSSSFKFKVNRSSEGKIEIVSFEEIMQDVIYGDIVVPTEDAISAWNRSMTEIGLMHQSDCEFLNDFALEYQIHYAEVIPDAILKVITEFVYGN